MQADPSLRPPRMRHHALEILRTSGIRGFWHGVGTTVTRAVILGATKLGTYAHFKQFFAGSVTIFGCLWPASLRLRNGGPFNIFTSSVLAGLCVASTTAPADFTRTRLMTARDIAKRTGTPVAFSSGFDVVRKTLVQEGPMAFYRGFFPQWYRFAPYTILQFAIWEQLCYFFDTNTT